MDNQKKDNDQNAQKSKGQRFVEESNKIPAVKAMKDTVEGVMGLIDLGMEYVQEAESNRNDWKRRKEEQYRHDLGELETNSNLHEMYNKEYFPQLNKKYEDLHYESYDKVQQYLKDRKKIQSYNRKDENKKRKALFFKKNINRIKQLVDLKEGAEEKLLKKYDDDNKVGSDETFNFVREWRRTLEMLERNESSIPQKDKEDMLTKHDEISKQILVNEDNFSKTVKEQSIPENSIKYLKLRQKVNTENLGSLYKLKNLAQKYNWMKKIIKYNKEIKSLNEYDASIMGKLDQKMKEQRSDFTFECKGDNKLGLSTQEELKDVNDQINIEINKRNRLNIKAKNTRADKELQEIRKDQEDNQKKVAKLIARKKELEDKQAKEQAGKSQKTSSSPSVNSSPTSGQGGVAADGASTSSANTLGIEMSTGKEAEQAPGGAAVDGKTSDTQNPKADAAAQIGMGGDKCSCCVELKAIRNFLENSKLSKTDKEKAGKKLDEFETIVTTEDHSEVSAAGGNIAPEAIEMSAGKMTEFTVPVEKINSSPVYMVDGKSGNPGRSVSVDNEINGGGNLPLYAMKEISCNTDKYKMKSSPDVYLWEWLGSGGMNKEAIKKQPSFHVPGIVGKDAIQKLPALPGPIGANAEITQNLPYIPGSEATGQNGFWKRPDFKGLDGLPRMPESVNNTGIRPDDISVKEQILRNYLYDRNKDNTGTSIAVDGALKPFPAATGGMTVEQDMVYRKDGDYRDYTRINGKPLKTFNPDVSKRHFPSSLKSAKNEIKESFRNKMNQPLNVAAAPVGTAGIDDARAQMTRVKEAPNPGENMQAVLNRMGQTLKHIDTVLNNRLPGDNF